MVRRGVQCLESSTSKCLHFPDFLAGGRISDYCTGVSQQYQSAPTFHLPLYWRSGLSTGEGWNASAEVGERVCKRSTSPVPLHEQLFMSFRGGVWVLPDYGRRSTSFVSQACFDCEGKDKIWRKKTYFWSCSLFQMFYPASSLKQCLCL